MYMNAHTSREERSPTTVIIDILVVGGGGGRYGTHVSQSESEVQARTNAQSPYSHPPVLRLVISIACKLIYKLHTHTSSSALVGVFR
jgi:hypothetical protein